MAWQPFVDSTLLVEVLPYLGPLVVVGLVMASVAVEEELELMVVAEEEIWVVVEEVLVPLVVVVEVAGQGQLSVVELWLEP